uniref:NB-ARC domain-containing protein n=1 Tax=Oryza nivara TaxID=4536 RepID=A0A0E0G5E7_ORYNI
MAESLLLPVVRGVIGKATDVLVQKVTRMYGVDGDHPKLERQLLADAESKSETNPAIKRWMKDLNAAADEADDMLNEFQYEALRREAMSLESLGHKVRSCMTPLEFRFTMSRKLAKVLKNINELVEEMNMFGLLLQDEPVHQLPYWQTYSALPSNELDDIFGRDDDKEAVVIKLLLDQRDQHKWENLQVLPIVGMGGLSKTMLAKMVYNDYRVQNHFELKMWHCVSDNFEVVSLLKSIIELATNKACQLLDNVELLQKELHKVVGRRRFMLVLDDSSVGGGDGSAILVTARSQQVASIMGTLESHNLAYLSDDDSWELFSKKAFNKGVQQQAELVTAGKLIVKKCKGLPLALKTMGDMMSSKQQVKEWETIARSNIGDNDRGEDDILPVLKLSFRHLPPEMKQCFAFCSVFTKDHEMDKEVLIQLWMANGFIQEDKTMGLEQKGEYVFRKLVWRSFLQDVKQERTVNPTGSIYRMLHISNESNSGIAQNIILSPHFDNSVVTTRSSIQSIYDILTFLGLTWMCCQYLDLSGSDMDVLPSSICTMYNLQTLRLNCCKKLRYLPEGMRTMSKLIHLYLFSCPLKRMPPNISLLKNLRTLTTFILDTEPGRGIEELKDLNHLANRLELYNLRKINSRKNGKDANLHLKQDLRCKDLSTVWFLVSIECMSLSKMENLTTLFMNVVGVKAEGYYIPLQIFPRLKDMTLSQLSNLEKWTESTAGEANTSLVTFPKLATLCISDCPKLASVPDCPVLKELKTYGYCSLAMSSLAHLTTLSELIYRENESMRMSLGSWPSLTKLHISSSYNQMATLEVDTNQGPLENLRILRLYGLNFFTAASGLSKMHLGLWKCFAFVEDLCIGACNDLVHWPMEELMSLIHLRSLSIEHCDNLEGKGSSSEEIMPLYYLEKFHIKDCKSLLDIPTIPASLEELCLLLCPRLVALPSNLGNLARLKTMSFEHCHDLKELPDGMDGLISLEELKITGVPRDGEISTGSPPLDSDPSIPNGSRLP